MDHSPRNARSKSSPVLISGSSHKRDGSKLQTDLTQMQALVPKLRSLYSSQELSEHAALVKHLQFSPDGQFLATCSCDKTAFIWSVGSGLSDNFEVLYKLVHTSRMGGFVGQVAWSPNGDQLLTRQLRAVKVWDTKVSGMHHHKSKALTDKVYFVDRSMQENYRSKE